MAGLDCQVGNGRAIRSCSARLSVSKHTRTGTCRQRMHHLLFRSRYYEIVIRTTALPRGFCRKREGEQGMHIHEAVLSGSPAGVAVLCAGAVATAAATAVGLRNMDYEQAPRVALVTSAFFVVSLFHVPLGVTSVHLVLNGLVGLLLGWVAFPALLVALLLQALMFGHGGLLALGINTLTMGLPAVASYYCFRWLVTKPRDGFAFSAGFAGGVLATLTSAFLTATALWFTRGEFEILAAAVLAFHLAVAVVEGLITGSAIVFLRRVRPRLLLNPYLTATH